MLRICVCSWAQVGYHDSGHHMQPALDSLWLQMPRPTRRMFLRPASSVGAGPASAAPANRQKEA